MNPAVRLSQVIDAQNGLVRRDQLAEIGIGRSALRWRLTKGYWQVVLPAVYATFDGVLSQRQRLVAAALYGGLQAHVTGVAALRVHGLRQVPADAFVRVAIPHARRVPSIGYVKVHRTRRPDRAAHRVDGLLVASVPRAMVDAVRLGHAEVTLAALLAEAIQGGHCSEEELREELAAAPRQHSGQVRQWLEALALPCGPAGGGGTRLAAREVLASSAVLPPVIWGPRLRAPDGRALPGPDGWIDEVDLGVEIDSGDPTGPGTAHRHAELASAGAVVVRFSAGRLRSDPAGVRLAVERAYLRRLCSGVRGSIHVEPPD